jgi:hypothetical protein
MTTQEAQVILLRAFIATGELPRDIAALLARLIDEAAPSDASLTR